MRTLTLLGALSIATVAMTVQARHACAESKAQGSEFYQPSPSGSNRKDIDSMEKLMKQFTALDADTGCVLPANIKGQGFKCDSVGDFGVDKTNHRSTVYSRPFKPEEWHEAIQTYLRHSVDTEITIKGQFKRTSEVASYAVSLPSGDFVYLVGATEALPEDELIQVSGELKFKSATKIDGNSVLGTPAYYYFDCSKATVRPLKPKN